MQVSPETTGRGVYRNIAIALRARIIDGEFAAGSRFPSESALREQYKVARNTMRRALDVLAAEGLLVAQPGRGRTVLGVGGTPPSSAPTYRAIAAGLRADIESGEVGPGDALPSESALAAQYGVARGTARHALAELEGAGLIESVHGKGRFVRNR
jgi:DNA-binding GntR family transcriptional regulator